MLTWLFCFSFSVFQGDPRLMFARNDKVYWEFIDLLNDRHQIDRFIRYVVYSPFSTTGILFVCLFISFLPSSHSLHLCPLLSPFPTPFFQVPPSLGHSFSQSVDWWVSEWVSWLDSHSESSQLVSQSFSLSVSQSVSQSVN